MRRQVALFLFALGSATFAFAGSTGNTTPANTLHTPQAESAGTANGDYVTATAGLDTVYRYWIEVPPGLGRLTVEVYDPDIGRGDPEANAGRDRDRGGGWGSQADYTLIRPNGTTAATLNNCDDNTCTDNAWVTILNSTTATNTAAGHWELRIDMNNGGNDINAIGVRAHDGTSGSGGTELNVYIDSMVSLGVNPDPGDNSRTYTFYPWITSGCTCSQNDFDRDSNSGDDIGSVTYTSRKELASGGTGFTQTFAAASLSGNNIWHHEDLTRWGDDDESDDYGIWSISSTINTYTTPAVNGNYETYYVGNYLAAGDPVANPITSGGAPAAFRLYLPTDGGGAPVKPYLEQFLTHNTIFSGPNPPVVGTQSVFTVTIQITNPTTRTITFNASNLVTANVPGGGVTYDSFITASQGSLVSAPAAGGTGNVTWNPGAMAGGTSALFAYNIRVTPPSAARLAVTGTPASGNGTRAQMIDETGNTTQARATYTMGGVCELAVTAGLATDVLLNSFKLDVRGGATEIELSTASEAGTIGFNVYRAGSGEKVNEGLIPASMQPHGGKYRLLDRDNADPGAMYIVEEVMAKGERKRYGPINHLTGIDREELMRRETRRFRNVSSMSHSFAETAKEKIVAAMVAVPATGIVRVTGAQLASALGEDVKSVTKALNKGDVHVTLNGAQVAWQTEGQNLYFFGQKSTSIYSNDRVYRVELAKKGTKMQTANMGSPNVPVSSFLATQDIETEAFVATVVPLDPESDFNFWDFFLSGDPSFGRRTFTVNVPYVASSSGASLSVRLQGAFKDGTHKAMISLNGVPVGEANWTSFSAHTATINLPGSVLRDGANDITIEGVLAPGEGFDVFYLDGFTVRYQRFASPVGGQVEVTTSGALGAGPFTTTPMILDVTNRNRPTVVLGASFQGGVASLSLPSTRSIFFAEGFVAPSSIRASYDARLRSQRADWVVIAPRAMRSAADSYASLRAREGLQTYVAELEQVYDEFSGGNLTPMAVRDFIRATRSWNRAPKYVVLAGNGNTDYRAIRTSPGVFPPLLISTNDGLYASDSAFADFNGDRLPDVAIGRIPVLTASELSAYVAKLDASSRISTANSPMVFSADAADGATSFRSASVEAERPLKSRPATRAYVDDLGAAGARNTLFSSWQAGSPLVSWVGHGGLDMISNSGVLTSYDASSLFSSGRLPVLVAMTCTINRFENGFVDPLGVALTREDDAGALAVWSASGLSTHSLASDIQRTFMHLAAQSPAARVGDLVVQSLAAHRNDTSSVYLLLGDPAIRLDLPKEVVNVGTVTPGE